MTSRSHWWRNIFAGLLLILGGCFLIGWWMIWRPLPELDGDLILPGVRQQILVDRDGWGVPWIQASSMEDLEIAQGYVVAQDRLWQMDLLRRAAGGGVFGNIWGGGVGYGSGESDAWIARCGGGCGSADGSCDAENCGGLCGGRESLHRGAVGAIAFLVY